MHLHLLANSLLQASRFQQYTFKFIVHREEIGSVSNSIGIHICEYQRQDFDCINPNSIVLHLCKYQREDLISVLRTSPLTNGCTSRGSCSLIWILSSTGSYQTRHSTGTFLTHGFHSHLIFSGAFFNKSSTHCRYINVQRSIIFQHQQRKHHS